MVWKFLFFLPKRKMQKQKKIWKNWWYFKNKQKLDNNGTNEIVMVIPSAASLSLSLSRQKGKHEDKKWKCLFW